MAYLVVDKDNSEYVYNHKPERLNNFWGAQKDKEGKPIGIMLPLLKGTIKKLIGRELTWNDEPVCIEVINNMDKDIKIIPPEGMEWYQEGNEIKFRNKKLRYSDVARSLFKDKQSHYIGNYGMINPWLARDLAESCFPNITTSVDQAIKLLAINKLMNVAKYLNQDWKPDWNNDGEYKYYIYIKRSDNKIDVDRCLYRNGHIFFKTKDLAKQAIDILGEDTIRLALSTDW